MRNTFLIISFACFCMWVIGLIFSASGLIHLLLVIAVIAFILWLISGDDNSKRYRNYTEDYHHEINY